jgi:hypothetical protein
MFLPLFIAECKTNLGTGGSHGSGRGFGARKNKGLAEKAAPLSVEDLANTCLCPCTCYIAFRFFLSVVSVKHDPKICLTGIEENAREMKGCESKY